MKSRRSVHWDRWDAIALAALVAVFAITATVVLTSTPVIGAFEDDGIYLVTAKSIAEGSGYRRLDLPGEPFQTKYPPLYPFLLSLIWRCGPGFPRNVPAMQIFNAMCGLLAGFAAYRLMRRVVRM